tara:strand:- start:531 stop:1109 length:579 start_codon:yes stop_codon:yes gene_type:complete
MANKRKPESITVPDGGIGSIKDRLMNTWGISKANRYEFQISGVPNEVALRLNMSCESIKLPGRGVSTNPHRVYGPMREMPYDKLYVKEMEAIFRIGRDMLERSFFENWLDEIVSIHSHDFKYYGTNNSGYAKTIKINQLDEQDNVVYQVELREAFPKNVQEVELGDAKIDEYSKQTVQFVYRDYKVLYSENY